MAQPLSQDEKQLITELAVGIARRLRLILKGFETGLPDPAYFWHGAGSPFEAGCEALWLLGVARAAYGHDPQLKDLAWGEDLPEADKKLGFPPYFRFSEAAEIRSILAEDFPNAPPSLDEVLRAYLPLTCEYGPQETALSCEREPFDPPPECAREVEALVRHGYMERQGSEVLWTEKIGAAMQATYLWQEDDRSWREAEAATIGKECAAALAATSAFTRWRLRRIARRRSELDFATFLRDRCDGLFWWRNPDGSLRPEGKGDVRLVKAVYRQLRQS